MRSGKNIYHNLPVLRYSFTYILLAAILILLLNISCYASFYSLEKKYLASNEKSVAQYVASLEQYIAGADNNIGIMLIDDIHFLSLQLLPRPVHQNDLYKVWKANEWLSNTFRLSQTGDFFFYFKNNDFFVSNDNVYTCFKSVYGSLFQFNQLGYTDFLKSMNLNRYQHVFYPVMPVKLNNIARHGMIYARAIPNKYYDNNVTSYVFIDESYLESLRSTILTKNHVIDIYDSDGHLLYTSGQPYQNWNKKKGVIKQSVSSPYGFTCQSEILRKDAFSELRFIKMFIYGTNSLALMFTLLYIYFNAIKSIGKIQRILGSVDKYPWNNTDNLFDNLSYVYNHLVISNNSLKITLDIQMDFMKTSVMEKLVSGRYQSKENFENEMNRISVRIPTDAFCIAAISSRQNISKEAMRNIGMILTGRGIASTHEHGTIIILIGLSRPEFNDYKTIMERSMKAIQEEIRLATNFSCLCCCSDLFEDISETAVHFELCSKILEKYSQRVPLGDILWSHDMQPIQEKAFQQKIVEYIGDNYPNHNLSLQTTAEYFQFSPSYFSAIFKQTMGESYSSYLESIRMARADSLVRTTSLKVEEIASRCGYSSSNTFLRAYKRHYGVSPKNRKSILC